MALTGAAVYCRRYGVGVGIVVAPGAVGGASSPAAGIGRWASGVPRGSTGDTVPGIAGISWKTGAGQASAGVLGFSS